MKKAMTIQFNWVFVLIAGALIISFFGSIIMKQRDLSERSTSQDTVLKLEKKLGVSLTEIGKTEEMNFQDKELIISCNELRSGKATTVLADPVFSPERVKGAKLITLTKAFRMPFHVTNFLYITSSSVRYILVYGDLESRELAENIKKDMGDKANVELATSLADLQDLGHYHTKIVFVNKDPHNADFKGTVRAVKISEDDNKLEFFKGNGMDQDGESIYLDDGTLTAAVFAEDKESYECGLRKALKKLKMMSELYVQKTLALERSDKVDDDCKNPDLNSDFYLKARGYLLRINEDLSTEGELKDIKDISISNLKTNVEWLETQNNLLIMNSCPEVY